MFTYCTVAIRVTSLIAADLVRPAMSGHNGGYTTWAVRPWPIAIVRRTLPKAKRNADGKAAMLLGWAEVTWCIYPAVPASLANNLGASENKLVDTSSDIDNSSTVRERNSSHSQR